MVLQVRNQKEFDKLTRKVKIRVTKAEPKPIVPEFLDDWHKETEKLKEKVKRLEKANERLAKENEGYRLVIQNNISQEALLERYPELRYLHYEEFPKE